MNDWNLDDYGETGIFHIKRANLAEQLYDRKRPETGSHLYKWEQTVK